MKVVKQTGDIVYFDRDKLRNSLLSSGAKKEKVEDILGIIEREVYDGMPTRKIYKMAFQLLKKTSKAHAARYNLKSAVQALGPAGFFFEKYIALLFRTEGFETNTNVILKGYCVSHEIDIMVRKDDEIAMVECKFHSNVEIKSDVKVPMYILSRFNDLKGNAYPIFGQSDTIERCWVITNNRFTTEAIQFGNCSGLKLVSWDFPVKGCLKYKIDENGLYPVTCLTTLTQFEKEELLIQDVLLASDLVSKSKLLSDIGINHNRIKNIIKEASELCDYMGGKCFIFKG